MRLRETVEAVLGGEGPQGSRDRGCGCEVKLEGARLVVEADACGEGGRLADSESCRAAVVRALADDAPERVAVRSAGWEHLYGAGVAGLFGAAGRFAAVVRGIDERLAGRARKDPLGAAEEATGRAGPVSEIAADTGLARYATESTTYASLLAPAVGPTASGWRVVPDVPPHSTLQRVTTLDTHARVRIYDVADRETLLYHLEPEAVRFDAETTTLLEEAHGCLTNAPLDGVPIAPRRAVRTVADDGAQRAALTRILAKHTREPGLLSDLFADPDLSDVYVTAPAPENALRVRVDGETLDSNVRLTTEGVRALASRFRRESGRGFSRAAPTLDAATDVGGRRIRVAGVTDPVSDGHAFAFRAHDRDVWTLASLVGNGTLSERAAGLLSVAVERGASLLLAGPRGSGKTTALGAILWEIPPSARTVVIEDAPELPVEQLQAARRDVQALRTDESGGTSPAEALRTALRLGDGALVLGEVRGEEARVLYEAMRVGANSEAVLGTIHGDGAHAVFERVVSDLGVPASSFGATDVLVTLEVGHTDAGPQRRVRAVEEVVPADPVDFATLFERTGSGLSPTGRIERGNSRLVTQLARPEEDYADVLERLESRAESVGRGGESLSPASHDALVRGGSPDP